MSDDGVGRAMDRRTALKAGVAVGLGGALAGCSTPDSSGGDEIRLMESFEDGTDGWETAAHIGPEEEPSEFEWAIERSDAQASEGDWSLSVFTEGDHDDGTAWATTALTPGDAERFEVTFDAWSESESFNTLRNVVTYLGPEAPTEEGDFPDPGMSSSNVDGAPYGGLREPLHLAEGWREYSYTWEPDSVPETLYFSVGVSVVWEADATHYVDDVRVVRL